MLKRVRFGMTCICQRTLKPLVDQKLTPNTLGKDSNALVWPRGPPDDGEENELNIYKNERFLRIGMYSLDLS
jgi:hypothetical protein